MSTTLSRNTGILESTLLRGRKVAIAGLGSGGSLVADQLARAGVGGLVLLDFDTLETHNVGRHLCDSADIGRLKTEAVADAVRRRNPDIEVRAAAIDIVKERASFASFVDDCEVLVGATDDNPSRRVVNRLALETGRPAIYGRAYTRACGGDVLRVAPEGPCFDCVFGAIGAAEEVSSARSAAAPAYADAPIVAEPGLALDIAPIAQMVARLVLVELVRGTDSSLVSLDDDLAGDLYLWANRREGQFADFSPMGFGVAAMAIMRWYAVRAARNPLCPTCNEAAFLDHLMSATPDPLEQACPSPRA
jgi:molybdopterin/thiamine biosynthesis adenylyltransferase